MRRHVYDAVARAATPVDPHACVLWRRRSARRLALDKPRHPSARWDSCRVDREKRRRSRVRRALSRVASGRDSLGSRGMLRAVLAARPRRPSEAPAQAWAACGLLQESAEPAAGGVAVSPAPSAAEMGRCRRRGLLLFAAGRLQADPNR